MAHMCVRLILTLAVLMSLPACAPRYVEADASVPGATLRVLSAARYATNSSWYAYSTETCEENDREGLFGNFLLADAETTIRIPVGQRLYLSGLVQTHYVQGVGAGVMERTTYTCRSMVSFVPEASHRYEATQRSSIDSCLVSIVEADSRAVPPSYEQHQPKGRCNTQ